MNILNLLEATAEDIQNRLPLLVNKYLKNEPNAEQTIINAAEADPTKGKYTEWIVRNISKGTLRFPEDKEKTLKNLTLFDKKKSKLQEKDINRYSPGDLAQALEQQLGLTKSERKEARRGGLQLPPGATIIASADDSQPDDETISNWFNQSWDDDFDHGPAKQSSGGYTIVKITDPQASTILCSGTEWCVANIEAAKSYISKGPLYLFYQNGERKYLGTFGEFQFMDVYDRPVDNELLEQLIIAIVNVEPEALKTNPADFIQRYRDFSHRTQEVLGKYVLDPYFMGYDKIEDPLLNTYMIVKATKNNHTEPAIKLRQWYESILLKSPGHMKGDSYHYNVRGFGYWPEAHGIIAQDPEWASDYAVHVLRKRWPEAEPTILKSPFATMQYLVEVVSERWPEAEPVLQKSPELWRRYQEYLNWWK